MISESDYHLAFHHFKGIGPQRFDLLLHAFGSARTAWEARGLDWHDAGFPPKLVDDFVDFRERFDFEKIHTILTNLHIHYLSRDDPQFPPLLKQIASCPIGLFIKGKILSHDCKALAVVGTRKVTPYGREVTEKFVGSLVRLGFTIVSGLARGVDGVAHRAALKAGGRTIAVLGNGLERIYPPEHKVLAEEIIQNGAIISEFPPFSPINPGNFPARNRLISGLTLGVLVTEGSQKSGTKLTAMSAVEQNREVFAVPGPITSVMSDGPAELIQMGAKLVLNERDILDELQIDMGSDHSRVVTTNNHLPRFSDSSQEKIWQYLINGVQHIDEIIRNTQLPAGTVATSLTVMELQGMIKNIGNGNYMAV